MTPQPATYGSYLPYEPPPPPPPPDPRKRRLLIVVSAVWAVVLLVTGIGYSWYGKPSAREQTTIEDARPTVDRATAAVLTAAGPAAVVTAFTGYDEVTTCAVTPARSGYRYERVVWLFTGAGSEPGLVDRIVAGLPKSYGAEADHSPGGASHTLTADAGNYVQVTGGLDRTGLLKIIVGTGCRTLGHRPSGDPAPGDADRAAVQPTVSALGMTGTSWSVHQLPCGARTVEASGKVTKPLSALHQAASAGAKVVVDRSDVYADGSGLAVRGDDNTATVTMTEQGCH